MLRLSCILKLAKILAFKNVSCSNLAEHSFARMNVAGFVASSTQATKNIQDIVVNNLFISAKVSFSTETSLDNLSRTGFKPATNSSRTSI